MKRTLFAVAGAVAVIFGAAFLINTAQAVPPPPVIGIVGPTVEGQPIATNPVPIGLKDPAGKIRALTGTDAGVLFTQTSAGLGALTSASSQSIVPATDTVFQIWPDNHKSNYYRFSASFTPQATAAVTLFTVTGSATKTVRVQKIYLTGHSTNNAQEIISLQRTSALGAGGTSVPVTAAKMSGTAEAAATAVVAHYTTTLKAAGTPVGGSISTQDFWTGVVTTPTVNLIGVPLFPESGESSGSSIDLVGTSDFLEVQSVNAGNLSAGTVLQYVVELVEE